MAKVISLFNFKGGVAKTITSINLGAALQSKGYKVLLVDTDPQANLTEALGISINLEQTIYEAMLGDCPLPVYENQDGLHLVPSCLDLTAIESQLLQALAREKILSKLLKPVLKKYDFIIIDCSPSMSLMTINALTTSDYVIIPVQSEFLAMRGMGKLTGVIDQITEDLNPKLKIAGIVITRFDGRKRLNNDVHQEVRKAFGKEVFETVIRENISLANSNTVGRDIFHFAPTSTGAQDYDNLCNELLKIVS